MIRKTLKNGFIFKYVVETKKEINFDYEGNELFNLTHCNDYYFRINKITGNKKLIKAVTRASRLCI